MNYKKFLLTLIMLFSATFSFSEIWQFKATSYAYKTSYYYGYQQYWNNWSNWITCDVTILMDLGNDVVTIYSQKPQRYKVIDSGNQYNDNGGGTNLPFSVIDQDYDRGKMRLRIESNGNSQIYIEFSNVMWVYNVFRIN